MIEVRDLYVKYGWRKEPVIKGVSVVFNNRHLVLGPNGSGKTTLFRAICGLTSISSGKILIDGIDLEKIYGVPSLLAINFLEVYRLFRLSAYDHIKIFCDLTSGDLDLALSILEELGVDLSVLKGRKLWELSAGQRKAFATALALASKAKHVLLDEPFEQLDPVGKRILLRYINEHRGVIVLNTHETWLLKTLGDWEVSLMFEGKIYGPVKASLLLESRLVVGNVENAVLRFEICGRVFSLVRDHEGESLTELVTLDKVYYISRVAS